MSFVLRGRLSDATFAPPSEADALLVDRLKAEDAAAWIALATFAGLHRKDAPKPDAVRLASIFKAAGISQDEAGRRMNSALPALQALYRSEPFLDPETAAAAAALFHDEPEFQPLVTVCATACPQTQDQCITAFVAGFGHPYGRATTAQPLTSLISTKDFFATPRGRLILLRSTRGVLGDTPATSPALTATRAIDACLSDAILAAIP